MFFVPKFHAKIFQANILCRKFWLRISARNFSMKSWAETFGTFFPCQNSAPKLWHPAKTFGTKLYLGMQMYRPEISEYVINLEPKNRSVVVTFGLGLNVLFNDF